MFFCHEKLNKNDQKEGQTVAFIIFDNFETSILGVNEQLDVVFVNATDFKLKSADVAVKGVHLQVKDAGEPDEVFLLIHNGTFCAAVDLSFSCNGQVILHPLAILQDHDECPPVHQGALSLQSIGHRHVRNPNFLDDIKWNGIEIIDLLEILISQSWIQPPHGDDKIHQVC